MKWKTLYVWLICVWLIVAAPVLAAEYRLNDLEDLADTVEKAQPGDVITLADGTYQSADLLFEAQGTAERPIVLRAATTGKVVLTGKSRLRIAGSHLVVEGLYFWNSFHPEGMIAFRRNSSHEAHHCRVTQCAVVDCNCSSEEVTSSWVMLFGDNNRVDHCVIQGKTYNGPELDVWIAADLTTPPNHQIDHNYFGPRPVLNASRSGEALRVGQGANPSLATRILIEGNLFDRCAGALDIVNNCASNVAYRQNTFLGSTGSLTFRSSHRCVVTSNFFLGNNMPGSGGIRLSGEEHTVAGNYFANLAGDGDLAAIALMDGYSSTKGNGYVQTKRCTIGDNVFVQCERFLTIGAGDRLIKRRGGDRSTPQECQLSGNLVAYNRGKIIDQQSAPERLVWRGNLFSGGDLGIGATPDAWTMTAMNLGQRSGMSWPLHVAARGPQLPPLQSRDFGPAWFTIVR